MLSEGKSPKYGEPADGFSFTTEHLEKVNESKYY
jgi:hypothetical protein